MNPLSVSFLGGTHRASRRGPATSGPDTGRHPNYEAELHHIRGVASPSESGQPPGRRRHHGGEANSLWKFGLWPRPT